MIYQEHAAIYENLGMWPRRITPGTKICYDKRWQLPNSDLPSATLQKWRNTRGNFGIGLLMGSPISDGTRLGALDIDRNEYTALGRTLLRNPICGRFGQKGAVFFVRVRGNLGNPEFWVSGTEGKKRDKVAECLFSKKLCVIPPTIHQDTKQPYHWIGTPLHEVDLFSLPLVGE